MSTLGLHEDKPVWFIFRKVPERDPKNTYRPTVAIKVGEQLSDDKLVNLRHSNTKCSVTQESKKNSATQENNKNVKMSMRAENIAKKSKKRKKKNSKRQT